MNSILTLRSFRGMVRRHLISNIAGAAQFRALAVALLALWAAGCGDSNAVKVHLTYRQVGKDPRRLEITAQVSGPQTGLRYKWISVVGQCDPQESGSPTAIFKFADGVTKDRVSVGVWRDNKCVGQAEAEVRPQAEPSDLTTQTPNKVPSSAIQIDITNIPPNDPEGGPSTHADIAGTVSGDLLPDCRVVIYARALDVWFIQPEAYRSQTILSNKTWSTWTHTGSSYAALVVRPGFDALPRMDVLPPLSAYVLARTNVPGVEH